jgi:pimeloyl-ACP methyl ester carboxylesterase
MASLLLIHGAWHGPWCWNEFANRLSKHGHEVRAVRLRGHEGRPGRIWHRMQDYAEDVARAAAEFDQPPIPVGHSMGGVVAQKYLERNTAPGAVLMATIAPGVGLSEIPRLAARHPLAFAKANLLLRLAPLVSSPALVRELFFSPETSQPVIDHCHARLQDESYPAYLDLLRFAARAKPRVIEGPVLVLGAERDSFLTVGTVRRTAAAYQTEAEIFPNMGHDMMLDHGWEDVADRIGDWLDAGGDSFATAPCPK